MSISRQYGLHELPGAEQPAPQPRRDTVSAGFESQMREYVNAVWAKLAELEGRIDDFQGWRTDIAEALKEVTGIDPRLSSLERPMLVADDREARGKEALIASSPKRGLRPWEAEGVSKATWYRRQKAS